MAYIWRTQAIPLGTFQWFYILTNPNIFVILPEMELEDTRFDQEELFALFAKML